MGFIYWDVLEIFFYEKWRPAKNAVAALRNIHKKSSLHSSVEMQAAFIFVLCDVSDGVAIPFCWRFHISICVKAATKVPQGYIRH